LPVRVGEPGGPLERHPPGPPRPGHAQVVLDYLEPDKAPVPARIELVGPHVDPGDAVAVAVQWARGTENVGREAREGRAGVDAGRVGAEAKFVGNLEENP